MNIISKLNSIFSFKEKKVEGAEVWMVYWYAYSTGCSINYPNVEQKAKAFLSYDEAKLFSENLQKCLDILQFDLSIDIIVKKQE